MQIRDCESGLFGSEEAVKDGASKVKSGGWRFFELMKYEVHPVHHFCAMLRCDVMVMQEVVDFNLRILAVHAFWFVLAQEKQIVVQALAVQ